MYLEREMPDSAKYYYILSKANEVSSNSFITQKSLFEGFYQVNEKLGNYKDAFENFKQFSAYSDSISSMRKQFNLTNLIKKYESEKKDKEIEILSKDKLLLGRDNEIQMLKIKEQEQGIQAFVLSNRVTQLELLSKQEKLKEQTLIALSSKKDNILLKTQKKLQEAKIVYGNEQISRRNILIYFFLVLIVLAVIFLAFLIYSNRLRRKANQKLKENNEMILLQKSQIEKKQTEILESVVYAKRIQNSILPTDKVMRELLGTYGVFYQPKDIVSGDFYWVYQSEDSVYFAVADCTGHGVPGAMVSVFGYNALRTVMDERKLRSPEQILSELHVIMEKSIKGLFDKIEVADGMDIGLCCINKRENQLWFSGANRPLYHFRNGMLNQIKGDKRGIGGHDLSESDTNIFKLHKIDIEKGDRFYLFSDGYADQFGVNKKKFMIQKLRNLLTSIQKETLSEQFNNLTQTFFSWKGVEEQTDDVLVLGIEV